MVHLRIVAPEAEAKQALALFEKTDSVYNVIVLEGVARKPEGHAILCDVAREDASVVIADLKEIGIHHCGSIAVEDIDSQISDVAIAAEKAAQGLPSDAVVWEEVESRTSENVELSASFLAFMVVATLIAAVGILTDQIILIIGAMVVGPEFGPLAGLCVALVHRRPDVAKRSLLALAVGFPLAITASFLMTVADRPRQPRARGLLADRTIPSPSSSRSPDEFTAIVAILAGVAGHPLAHIRQVRRPGGRPDLRDDDPCRGQHRRCRSPRRLGGVGWSDGSAHAEPHSDRRSRAWRCCSSSAGSTSGARQSTTRTPAGRRRAYRQELRIERETEPPIAAQPRVDCEGGLQRWQIGPRRHLQVRLVPSKMRTTPPAASIRLASSVAAASVSVSASSASRSASVRNACGVCTAHSSLAARSRSPGRRARA